MASAHFGSVLASITVRWSRCRPTRPSLRELTARSVARGSSRDGQAWSNVVGIPGKERGAVAIDADGPDDAWAVGSAPHGTLITHWDGTAWRVVHDGGLGHG